MYVQNSVSMRGLKGRALKRAVEPVATRALALGAVMAHTNTPSDSLDSGFEIHAANPRG